jgi:hypothetical protein
MGSDMNRFYLEPRVNPAFKTWQPLPALVAISGCNQGEALSCQPATSETPREKRPDFWTAKPDAQNRKPVNELPRLNLLCKPFAFTGVS